MTEKQFDTKFTERLEELMSSINFETIEDGIKIIEGFQTFYELGLLDAKKKKQKKK